MSAIKSLPDVTETLRAAALPFTESCTTPVVSLLVTVTALAKEPLICAPDEFRTPSEKVPAAKLIVVPDVPLGRP